MVNLLTQVETIPDLLTITTAIKNILEIVTSSHVDHLAQVTLRMGAFYSKSKILTKYLRQTPVSIFVFQKIFTSACKIFISVIGLSTRQKFLFRNTGHNLYISVYY